MASTVDWAEEMSTKLQTDIDSSEAMTTSAGFTPSAPMSLFPFRVTVLFFGVLGTLTNGLVLGGFWLSDRSKLTSNSIHIINHTTLEQSTFSRRWPDLNNRHISLSTCLGPSCDVTYSYDPWASRLLGYCGEILIGYSWRISALRQLRSGGDGFVHPGWRRNVAVNRDEWRSGLRGGPHPWPLLEDRSPDPPSQVLPPLDAPRRTVPVVVERRCGWTTAGRGHKQNCQRRLPLELILAIWSYGKGTFRFYVVSYFVVKDDWLWDMYSEACKPSIERAQCIFDWDCNHMHAIRKKPKTMIVICRSMQAVFAVGWRSNSHDKLLAFLYLCNCWCSIVTVIFTTLY